MEKFMFDVNLDSTTLEVLCHRDFSHLTDFVKKELAPFNLHEHFALYSSGTTGGDLKGYVLSKKALFKNAEAVNTFFNLTNQDTWGLSLPVYHVGGLSVLCRAKLLGNKVIDLRKWEPHSWREKVHDVTITSIVPTQLYDLVKLNLTCPKNLRYLIVGGDYLSTKLKLRAQELGYPVIRTFGMSEVGSQLASAKTSASDELEILPIHKVKTMNKRLYVKSESLFTLEFTIGDSFKVTEARDLLDSEGYYETKDNAEVTQNILTPLGRVGEEFKVAGHLVNLNKLKDTLFGYLLDKDLYGQMEFQLEADERKGHKLILLSLREFKGEFKEISDKIAPIKIDEIKIIKEFNRTALGKLKK